MGVEDNRAVGDKTKLVCLFVFTVHFRDDSDRNMSSESVDTVGNFRPPEASKLYFIIYI